VITDKAEVRLHAFGSSCHIVVDNSTDEGDEWLSIAQEEIRRLELKFSAYHPDSIISRINQEAGTGSVTPIDPETRSLFQYVSALWDESNHLFDPTTRLLQNCYNEEGRHRLVEIADFTGGRQPVGQGHAYRPQCLRQALHH
jgi:thiamine biosynthesis lipoprotein